VLSLLYDGEIKMCEKQQVEIFQSHRARLKQVSEKKTLIALFKGDHAWE